MDLPPTLRRVLRRLLQATRDRFAIDTRSLAAFRIALGLLLVADVVGRSLDLRAHYTDFGVLPRAALVSRFLHPQRVSVHLVSGEPWAQAALFALAGTFAVALAVGFRTRFATVASWFLLISLHVRNPLVLNGGDVLLRMLLFWGMFLPLGERWSIDARRASGGRSSVVGVATAALLVQVVVVYALNAAFKSRGELWERGEALYYVFSLDFFTVFLGDFLFQFPGLLRALTYLWLAMVTLSVLLIVLPGVLRIGFVSLFVGMHLGMALTMNLGLFPLISIAGLLPFLPDRFWDAAIPRLVARRDTAARVLPSRLRLPAPSRWTAALDAALPEIAIAGVPAAIDRRLRTVKPVVVAGFLLLVLLWNLGTLGAVEGVPEPAEPVVYAAHLDQYWIMFAPDPLRTDGWYVVPGRLENGGRVDALYGTPVQWDRPPDVDAMYPNNRWRKYLTLLRKERYADHRRYFAGYLCRRWNSHHDTTLVDLTIYYREQPTRPDYEPEPIRTVELWDHTCAASGR